MHEAILWLGFTHICRPSIHTKTHALQFKKKKNLLFFIFVFPQTTVIRNHLKKKFAHNECISHEETVDEENIANC